MTLRKHASSAASRAPAEPDLYGLSVNGNCMAPDYPDGCNVRVSKTETYAVGDVVSVWFRPEFVTPGGQKGMIKRVAMMPPPWVKGFPYTDNPKSDVLALMMLASDDRPKEWLQVRCADILAIHKVLGILKPEETGPDYRDELPSRVLKAEEERRQLSAPAKHRRRPKQIPDHSPAIHVNPDRKVNVSEVSP